MELYRIEYNNRLKQDRYGNGKGFVVYILGIDESDCKNGLYRKLGEKNVFVKLIETIPIHGITQYQVNDIISRNYEIYKQIDDTKQKEREINKSHMDNLLEQKKREGYDIDDVINDGMERKKEKQDLKKTDIWDSNKY